METNPHPDVPLPGEFFYTMRWGLHSISLCLFVAASTAFSGLKREKMLPLPKGEGWGEGEADAARPMARPLKAAENPSYNL